MPSTDKLISQRQAIAQLRAHGKSVEESIAIARRLAVVPDRKRMKLTQSALTAEIDKLFEPVVVVTIRGLSERHKQRFRAAAETAKILNGLRERTRQTI